MTPFINDHFLLQNHSAQRLYHEYAANEPIFDYHCHLVPQDLANNRQYKNLFEIWLEGDHYKWRAMRLHGTEERYCTGDAEPFEKFKAFAATVPHTLRNPLYHWTHLELARYFDIQELLNAESAPHIWENANAQLANESHSTWGILDKFQVKFIGTTDDPTDSLEHHQALSSSACPAKVAPSFRPDKAFFAENIDTWNAYMDNLSEVSGTQIQSLDDLKAALKSRIDFFDSVGCKASDHGLLRCPNRIADDSEANASFTKARNGDALSNDELEGYVGNLLASLGEQYSEKGWVMQLHLGALRNVNTALYEQLGTDIGCDSITDELQIPSLAKLLGELSSRNGLPKTILYNLNPTENYTFATMCGNFFEAGLKGKVHFGTGWWFCDQWEGMNWQINALSNLGLLSHFLGMLTDSRSLMSYPRHEYFRRLLCQLLGSDMEQGVIPNDFNLVGGMVKNICYSNASNYFNH